MNGEGCHHKLPVYLLSCSCLLSDPLHAHACQDATAAGVTGFGAPVSRLLVLATDRDEAEAGTEDELPLLAAVKDGAADRVRSLLAQSPADVLLKDADVSRTHAPTG